MSNQKQLALLKRGVQSWNKWREEHLDAKIDLAEAELSGSNLTGADLNGADLSLADLSRADLFRANLTEADLRRTDLTRADLFGAKLYRANLSTSNLFGANFRAANLTNANLGMAGLSLADFSRANLRGADLSRAILSDANLEECMLGYTSFGDVDLSTVRGLERAKHDGPSTIGIDTIYKSKGNIPEVFLRGAGVQEDLIPWIRELRGKATEFYSCFISYSSKDQKFAERLHADLQSKGVRVWFAPDDMKIGDRIHETIEDAIRFYDKLMVVLSENSIESAWVEREVKTALAKEEKAKRTMLFPVRLDDAVMHTTLQWAHDIRNHRHIGDFCMWKEHDAYQKSFARLLRDLQGKADLVA